MTTEEMCDYFIDIIRTDGFAIRNRIIYFIEAESRKMSFYKVKWLYNLCYLNFDKRRFILCILMKG